MNPYKVLGVSKRAGDKQIKNAYRRLAKKYHPDQNIGTPDEKKAEERMKQINEAYAAILSSRKQKKFKDAQRKTKQSAIPIYCAENGKTYQRIRQELKTDNLRMAGILLQRVSKRDAEWYFLSGEVYFQKKWYEEAKQAYEKAAQANPANQDYRAALEKIKSLGDFDTPKINFRALQSKITSWVQRRGVRAKTKV